MEERPYQQQAENAIFERFAAGDRSTLAVLPTGTGKTVLAGMVCRRARKEASHAGRVLFLANRIHLVKQAARTLRHMGLKVAVDSGTNRPATSSYDVCVATVQSLKGDRLKAYPERHFEYIVADECHHALSSEFARVLKRFHEARHLGITATPWRGDKKNLGRIYESRAFLYQMVDAIDEGWLVPVIPYIVPVKIDLRGINSNSKENKWLNAGDLSLRIGPHIEKICAHVLRDVEDRQTAIFTPCRASALATANCLRAMGLDACYVAGGGGPLGMGKAELTKILHGFERMDHQALVCSDLLEEGWDCPPVAAVVNMRPTASRLRYIQRVGRGTRRCDEIGKEDCVVLDFDWTAPDEARSLCCAVDLYDDGETPLTADEKEEAQRFVREGCRDFREAIEKAKAVIRSRPRLEIHLEGVRPEYAKMLRDPRGTGKILGKNLTYFDLSAKGGGPSTEGQRRLLAAFGIEHPERMGKWGAIKLINEVKRRQKLQLATVHQVQDMLSAGFNESRARTMSAVDATAILDAIRRGRPAC